MRVVIFCDENGVEKVEIEHANERERRQAYSLYQSLRAELERLDTAAKTVLDADALVHNACGECCKNHDLCECENEDE